MTTKHTVKYPQSAHHFSLKLPILFASKVSALLLCILLCSCTTLSPKNTNHAVHVDVKDNLRIQFTGKGAGAGMMLMSSMGPMGIAVGIAIDEGIGKEIDTKFKEAGGDLAVLTKSTINNAPKIPNLETVSIEQFLFKLVPATNDAVEPHLVFTVICKHNQSPRKLEYNSQVKINNELPLLNELKENGEQTKQIVLALMTEMFSHSKKLDAQQWCAQKNTTYPSST